LRGRDARGQSIIAFPNGCAYRRVLQRWLGRRHAATARTLELNSYHAIVACVASGSGIALVPESVLETMPGTKVRRHDIARSYAEITTPLIWRPGEVPPSVIALRSLVVGQIKGGRVKPAILRAAQATNGLR